MKILLILLVIIATAISYTIALGNQRTEKRQKRDVTITTYKNNYNSPSPSSSYSPTYGNTNYNNYNKNNYNYYNNNNNNNNKKNKPVVCKPSLACADMNSIPSVDVSWMTEPRLYYVIAQSCYASTNMANVLLGRPVRTELEFDQMCLTFFVNVTEEWQSGYGKQIRMHCYFMQNGGRNCVAAHENSDPSIDLKAFESAQCVPVFTDGATFTIYIRCQNNKQDILLLSSLPYVEEIAFVKLLDVAYTSGFPISEIKVPACYFPSYPHPFEEYPEDSGPYSPNSCISPYSTASALFAPPSSSQTSYY